MVEQKCELPHSKFVFLAIILQCLCMLWCNDVGRPLTHSQQRRHRSWYVVVIHLTLFFWHDFWIQWLLKWVFFIISIQIDLFSSTWEGDNRKVVSKEEERRRRNLAVKLVRSPVAYNIQGLVRPKPIAQNSICFPGSFQRAQVLKSSSTFCIFQEVGLEAN